MRERAEQTVRRIDLLIRQGKGGLAREALDSLCRRKVSRQLGAGVAWVAWRCGRAELGLRVLFPAVRPDGNVPAHPTAAETAEYAACLIRVGAVREASQLLDRVSSARYPRVLLYRAFAHVAVWDYASSMPLLREYLDSPGIGDYERLVARINLAAGLVYERKFSEARFLLNDLLHESSVRRLDLALGRALELSAESFLMQKKWAEAERFLAKAEERLAHSASLELFHVRKFRVFAAYLESRGARELRTAMRRVRTDAETLGHWASVRDCDRVVAMARKDDVLFAHVCYGTPYPRLRERYIRDCGWDFELPADHVWVPSGGQSKRPTLDLLSGEVDGRKATLKVGHASHRLLGILASDFYRPFRTAVLFAELFPGEYFNPSSASLRVRVAVARLRDWFSDTRLPLKVVESEGAYRLSAVGPCGIRISRGGTVATKNEAKLRRLRDAWPKESFSASDAGKTLGVSTRTALRVLEEALAEGTVQRVGASTITRYAFFKSDAA